MRGTRWRRYRLECCVGTKDTSSNTVRLELPSIPASSDINTRDTRVHSVEHGRTMDRHRTLEPPSSVPQTFAAIHCSAWTFDNSETIWSLIENRGNSIDPRELCDRRCVTLRLLARMETDNNWENSGRKRKK